MTNEYHKKKYTNLTAFAHTRRQEVKLMRAAQKEGVTKSEILRRLIDTL